MFDAIYHVKYAIVLHLTAK